MKELKILYLEDSASDAEFAGRVLKKAGIEYAFNLVDTKEEYENALITYQPDVVLADHSLFQFNSSEALKIFKNTGMKIPFILVTGTVSEEFAVKILKEGADDYLLKSNLVRLPNAIMSSLEKYRLERERQEYLDSIITNEAMMKEAEGLAHIGSWEADSISGEVKWSDEIFRIYGYEPGQVTPGHNVVLQHIYPEDRPSYQRAIFSLLSMSDAYSSELRVIDKNGVHKFVSFKTVVKRDGKGQFNRLFGFMQDVTEKRKLEKELAMRALDQQKLITEVTIQAQEKERTELGQELHDNINQILATVKMYLKMAMGNSDPAKKDDLMGRSFNNLENAVEEIRKLSKSLVAPTLGDMGIAVALEDLAEEINQGSELQVQVVTKVADKERIDKNMEVTLYRIAQEQLNNIRKYAKAKNARITLSTDEDRLFFSISDDGIGFDTNKKAKGIGLRNIASRVDFYSGDMKIISAPEQGCSLEISIPLQN
jgi:two-component system, NarL family, sensor histidine kinase UhpB